MKTPFSSAPAEGLRDMEERAAQKVPVLLECGHTDFIDADQLDWNGKYWCGICGHYSIIDPRRRPIRKIER